jgi:hypothetical protein
MSLGKRELQCAVNAQNTCPSAARGVHSYWHSNSAYPTLIRSTRVLNRRDGVPSNGTSGVDCHVASVLAKASGDRTRGFLLDGSSGLKPARALIPLRQRTRCTLRNVCRREVSVRLARLNAACARKCSPDEQITGIGSSRPEEAASRPVAYSSVWHSQHYLSLLGVNRQPRLCSGNLEVSRGIRH